MTRIRPFRPLLALALLPAAAGVALASTGSFAAASPTTAPTAQVQLVRSTAPTRVADDHGGNRPKPRPVRTAEAGDDSGGHGTRTATRRPEAGDDHGVHPATTRTAARTVTVRSTTPARIADDHGGTRPKSQPTRTVEAGDDSGGHGGRTATAATSGHGGHDGHGSSGGHHGADDGPNHS
jgi:hypothetical protein